ncbi:MAG: ankyrin repeat domain-containing protein [Bryobacteraceae bacterium]
MWVGQSCPQPPFRRLAGWGCPLGPDGLLLDAKANVNAVRWDGETAPMAAVNAGNLELVKLLLDRGANVNAAESRMGQTVLMWAVADGRAEIARTLVARGADLHVLTQGGGRRAGGGGFRGAISGLTPFLVAAQSGNVAMMGS